MGEHEKSRESKLDEMAIQREILAGRKFSIAEAIGRIGGKGLLKGASPVASKRQAEFDLKHALREHLSDSEGALRTVLLRRITESRALLDSGYRNPTGVLAAHLDRMLQSDVALEALVRETDMQWGRQNDTRPHFEREGQPDHPDDAYTPESVRAQLTGLRAKLSEVQDGSGA